MTITETIAAARAAGKPQAVFAVETVGEMLTIARAFAASDPYARDQGGRYCRYCAEYGDHAPDCVWVRSGRLMAAMEGTDGGMR